MNEFHYQDVLLWSYIDGWSQIPTDILEKTFADTAQLTLQFENKHGFRKIKDGDKQLLNMQVRRYEVPSELDRWLRDNTLDFDEIGVQLLSSDEDRHRIYPHCDKNTRRWAFMYVHDAGGSDVNTCFYRQTGCPIVRPHRTMVDDLSLIEEVARLRVEPYRWIVINGLVLHDVYPITSVRKSIVCGIERDEWFIL